MLRRTILLAVFVLSGSTLISAQSTRNTGRPITHDTTVHMPVQAPSTLLQVYVTGGLVTGDIVEYMKERAHEDAARRAVYGFGIGADRRIFRSVRAGLWTELAWFKPADLDNYLLRIWSFGISTMWLLMPEHRNSLYLRANVGASSLNATSDDDDNIGTHAVAQLGLGLQTFTGSSSATRFELFYRIVYTEGQKDHHYRVPDPIPFNLPHFGVQMAWAFGL